MPTDRERLQQLLSNVEWSPSEKEWLLAYLEGTNNTALQELMQEWHTNELRGGAPGTEIPASLSAEMWQYLDKYIDEDTVLLPGSSRVYFLRRWKWIAAAALLLAVIACWWLFQWQPQAPALTQAFPVERIPADTGSRFVILPDGSTVLLNHGSRISYKDPFTGPAREVTLIGEGYFDIRNNKEKPFLVHTGNITTTVLGTAFNVRAYPGQEVVIVTVAKGKVKVGDDKRTFGILAPDDQIAVNRQRLEAVKSRVDAATAIAWKKEYLVLNNISLQEAAVLIGNKYHVQIRFAGDRMKGCHVSATFLNNESLEQVLKVVTGVVNATYTIGPDNQVILNGEGCN